MRDLFNKKLQISTLAELFFLKNNLFSFSLTVVLVICVVVYIGYTDFPILDLGGEFNMSYFYSKI